MVQLAQARVSWTGMKGGPGVSTFYWLDTDGAQVAALKTFFEAVKGNIAASVTIKYPSTGLVIDDSSGAAVGTWAAAAPADTVCTGAGAYSAAAGAVINWRTGVFTAGRELRGKTFLVPMPAAAFTTDGQITSAAVAAIKTAAAGLYALPKPIRVYSPSSHVSAGVVATDVPTITAVLRSRRN